MKYVNRTTVATASLIITAALGLAGCGNNSNPGSMPGMTHTTPTAAPSSSAASAAQFNDADVTFATQMIPHHQQAVEMADMATSKATTAAVKQLATAIKAAQDPEIQQMSGWLTSWGKPVPTPGMQSGHNMSGSTPSMHSGHNMPGSMPGMMTKQEMTDLGKATGTMFDRMWLQMMIKHHQGAVTMAKTEQTAGKDPAAIALANKIETAQNREIATMQKLLDRLPAN
ncbi:MAG: hypothetical protein QOG10_1220 [Kribbellaceae bacterium]|nr:hypothetical protein [Kribbellaceae bacterium]